MPRSEESRLDSMADPSKWGDFDENDPKSMARMMKKMGSEMGEELGPEFNEVVDRLDLEGVHQAKHAMSLGHSRVDATNRQLWRRA